jgi:Predicted Zn peptidase
MGISKRRFLRSPDTRKSNIQLMNTPEDILGYAGRKGIEVCPLDVEKLANEMGAKVLYADLKDNISGMLEQDSNGSWVIRVNKSHHPTRQRYTIAHELGHYCLHRSDDMVFEDQVFFRNVERTPMETEANHFAAELLMPVETFEKFLRDGIVNVEDLALKFNVSPVALRVRAQQLGYLK